MQIQNTETNEQTNELGKEVGTKLETRIVQIGKFQVGGPRFTVIAGPCSIESESQFFETSEAVKSSGAAVLRGGIWKMRTSQKSFQGLGSDSFELIKRVKSQVDMPLVSEITDIRQIEEAFEVVDAFQVGARNMHNYSLLKELGRQPKPVLLKRNFSAFIDEWLKAADYIISGGNTNVILCERGIRTFETAMRNTLDLNAVVYVKKHSQLPIIVDPSHAVGISDLVPQLCYASAAVGADGIMVEVHPRPLEALSDGPQALDLPTFEKTMRQLERILNTFDRQLNSNIN